MNRFLISKIYIENFRGYKKEEFSFFKNSPKKKGLILLGGPNGFGKTSLLDAIEWCLSGNVRRLENEFRMRNKGESENQLLQKGIFKNIYGNGDTIVRITAQYKDENVIIQRVFNGRNEREIFEGISKTTIEASSDIKQEIEEIIEKIRELFYDRYICSYEKNIQIYQKGREDIYNMFSSFFGSNPQIEKVIENLEGNKMRGSKRVKGIIEEFEEQLKTAQSEEKDSYDKFKIAKETLKKEELKYKELSGYTTYMSKYPEKLLFAGEEKSIDLDKIEQETLKKKEIFHQKELLRTLSNIPLCKNIRAYLRILDAKIELENFRKELIEPFKMKARQILLAQQTTDGQLLITKKRIDKATKLLRQMKSVRVLVRYVNVLIGQPILKESGEFNQILRKKIDELIILKDQLQNLLQQKVLFENSAPVIEALRALVDHISGFEKYKENGNVDCPLCGSTESFANCDIALKAKVMLGKEDFKRVELEKQLKALNREISTESNTIRSKVIMQLEKINKDLDIKIEQIESIKKIRLAATKYNFDFSTLDEKRLVDREDNLVKNINELLLNNLVLETSIFDCIEQEDNTLKGITSIINPLQDATKAEFIQWSLKEKKVELEKLVKENEALIEQIEVLSELTQEDFDSVRTRIFVLEKMEKYSENTTALKEAKQNNEKAQAAYSKALKTKCMHQKHVNELKTILSKTKELKTNQEQKMTEQIIDPVNQLYRRINRHTNFTDIGLTRRGITSQKSELIVTDQNKNECFISNVLSTGQLSTLAVSIFFATALRHKDSKFRCYFMDDPIQSMDDLNILSFVDLLRTETVAGDSEDEGFFDQIFISTCDEDLENLILHKLRGFGANYCNFHFTGYGQYTESSACGAGEEILIKNE